LPGDDGRDGFDLIKKVRPDIVILDIIMPIMTGEDVLEAINKENLTDKVPVIVISNKSDGAIIYKCKKLGAREYLIKVNIVFDEVLEKIDAILQHSV